MAHIREKNQQLESELGVIGITSERSIAIRQLAYGGELNTWRFRVNKPTKDYEYCFGIVDVDQGNAPILPDSYRPNFQVVECQSEGETSISLSFWRDKNSKWFVKFQEFESQAVKTATATRMDCFSDSAMSNAVQVKTGLIQSSINPLTHDNHSHGNIVVFEAGNAIWLVRSEKPKSAN